MRQVAILLMIAMITVSCSSDQSENNIYALVISKNNDIVEETYYNGKSANDLVDVQSVTKSILSILIGQAIDQGLIKSEDTPVYQYFPEESELFRDDKKRITIKHLLNHTSGLNWKGYLEHEAFLQSEDPVRYTLERELEHQPGEKYNYNSGGTHVLSAILSKVTGQSTLEYANEVLFQPLGINEVRWTKMNDGICDGAGFGLSLRPRDLVSIGELILAQGNKDGHQLINQEWIGKSTNQSLKKGTKWGLRKSKHGYGWYAAEYEGHEVIYAMGYGGQFIFVIPSKELVIVCAHNVDTPDGIDQQVDFIVETLPQLLSKYGDPK